MKSMDNLTESKCNAILRAAERCLGADTASDDDEDTAIMEAIIDIDEEDERANI